MQSGHSTPRDLPGEVKAYVQSRTYTGMFITTLFLITTDWQPPVG